MEIFSSELLSRSAAVGLVAIFTWLATSLGNYFRSRSLASFLSGHWNEYWPPRGHQTPYFSGTIDITFNVLGAWFSLYPFHNIVMRYKAPTLSLDQTYHVKAKRAGSLLELDLVDLSTGKAGHLLLTIPANMNLSVVGGISMGLSMTGEPMACPIICSRRDLASVEVIQLLNGERAIRHTSSEFLGRVADLEHSRRVAVLTEPQALT